MRDLQSIFAKVEEYKAPSTILFRAIELKLLAEKFDYILKTKPVLDLGCGRGIAAAAIFGHKLDYGLDNDRPSLEKAKKDGVYQKTLLAEVTNIPLPDQSIGLVFANCVIEHIRDLDMVLSEVYRILNKGGYFIFTTPSDKFWQYSLFSRLKLDFLADYYGKLRNKKYYHYNAHSLDQWFDKLTKAGFKPVDGYYYIDQRTLELWDTLLIVNKPLNFLEFSDNGRLGWIYHKIFRQRIHQHFLRSKVTNNKGAAVCVLVQKP